MRSFWIPLLFASAGLVSAQPQPWDALTYDQALNDPRKTVVDYFLLCRDFYLESNGGFDVVPNGPPGPGAFEDRKNLLRKGFSTAGISVDSVVVDIPDAYISISGVADSFNFSLTFVFFDRKGKSDIPAYTYSSQGVDGDIFDCRFYERDGTDNWTEVTNRTIPTLSLSDLEIGLAKPRAQYPDIGWEYILPQKGTTVLADPTGSAPPLDKHVKELLSRKIELVWDNSLGRFSKGKVVQ